MQTRIRHDWSRQELTALYEEPLLDLLFRAQTLHRQNFPANQVQKSTLLSIKTGACSEDCAYCPQSAHYQTGLERQGLLPLDQVLAEADKAKASGSTRFCMGAAWRSIPEGPEFDRVLEMVKKVSDMGLEVCCTLGMLTENQAQRLSRAGLGYYNHNLDTSPEYYDKIITTRTYQDRLQTLQHVRRAGIQVCCGGIIGMGETLGDRMGLLENLANQNPHPESVPINVLVPIEGTPLQGQRAVEPLELVRMIATARIIMPLSFVRLSAGRKSLSTEAQALCFMAGANSIFAGDKLLTTPNPEIDADQALFKTLGLKEMGREVCRPGVIPAKAGI